MRDLKRQTWNLERECVQRSLQESEGTVVVGERKGRRGGGGLKKSGVPCSVKSTDHPHGREPPLAVGTGQGSDWRTLQWWPWCDVDEANQHPCPLFAPSPYFLSCSRRNMDKDASTRIKRKLLASQRVAHRVWTVFDTLQQPTTDAPQNAIMACRHFRDANNGFGLLLNLITLVRCNN